MGIQIGPAIKSVRQKRGFSAKSMYDGLMSRSNYARFEDGAIDTSAANLHELTKRLNVSLPEWNLIYDQLNGRDAGKITNRVNALLNQGWSQADSGPLYEAARLCADLYATYHYPNEHLSGLMAQALGTYLDNGKDGERANPALAQVVTYLDDMETWYANDVACLFNVLQILPLATLLRMMVRYLLMVKNNPWLGQGSTNIPSQQEVLQQSFATAIEARDWAAFEQLLGLFNDLPMSERYLFPTMMRRVYNAYDEFHRSGHDQTRAVVDPILTLLAEADSPANRAEVLRQDAALRDWCAADGANLNH